VACADIDEIGAAATAEGIRADGGDAISIGLDVTDPEANDDAARRVLDAFGSLHIVHLNAGVGMNSMILDMAVEDWDRLMAVNLRGVFLGMQSFGRVLREHDGGSIVVTSSGAGLLGARGMGAYSATKFGVVGLVKCAAIDLGRFGIRVNAVCPGVIDTPILGGVHGKPQILDMIGSAYPLGRVGKPEEVGTLVAFLAGDDASYITGGTFTVDGGITAALGGRQR